MRYFSISVVDLSSPRQTTQTIGDVVLKNNSIDDEATLYLFCHNLKNISLQLYPPTDYNSEHDCWSNIEYFGVLYRQLLPQFENEIPEKKDANKFFLRNRMKEYYPEIKWY